MIYIVGLTGFAAGFVLGQMILLRLLRGVPKEKLLMDKRLQRKYGTLNWLIALSFMAAVLFAYARWIES